jgi:SAM-dependent methyltransferase
MVAVRILELGCGAGDLLAKLEPVYGYGIDLSPRLIGAAKSKYPVLHFETADAGNLQLEGEFDFIICSDLLNDLWDVQTVAEPGREGQPLRHKGLSRVHYQTIAANRAYSGEIEPFGDFDLLFGAARYNLKILGLPIPYWERKYGRRTSSDGSMGCCFSAWCCWHRDGFALCRERDQEF